MVLPEMVSSGGGLELAFEAWLGCETRPGACLWGGLDRKCPPGRLAGPVGSWVWLQGGCTCSRATDWRGSQPGVDPLCVR